MKNKNLITELNRMKRLSGILLEEARVETKVGGMILKLDDYVKSEVQNIQVPEIYLDNNITRLQEEKTHITLTSIKNFKPYMDNFEDHISNIEIPSIKLGEAVFVRRDEIDKISYVISIENQEELKRYVDSLYEELGLENPEPDRFFHITIANNKEGNPYESIGDVTKADFIK